MLFDKLLDYMDIPHSIVIGTAPNLCVSFFFIKLATGCGPVMTESRLMRSRHSKQNAAVLSHDVDALQGGTWLYVMRWEASSQF